MLCCDQVQLCQLSDQRVVVDQLKQITSSLSNLVGANSADDIKQLTVVDMDRYLQLSQTFTDRSRQIEAVYRQANDVMYSVHLCFGGSTIPGIYPGPLSLAIPPWVGAGRIAMVSSTAGEETASFALQLALLSRLLAYWFIAC